MTNRYENRFPKWFRKFKDQEERFYVTDNGMVVTMVSGVTHEMRRDKLKACRNEIKEGMIPKIILDRVPNSFDKKAVEVIFFLKKDPKGVSGLSRHVGYLPKTLSAILTNDDVERAYVKDFIFLGTGRNVGVRLLLDFSSENKTKEDKMLYEHAIPHKKETKTFTFSSVEEARKGLAYKPPKIVKLRKKIK